TYDELKKEQIKNNDNLVDVLKRGYGDREDITTLFVALARAAGFEANLLMVSDRRRVFFSRELLTVRQLSPILVVVRVNGADVFLQPGIPRCPYGLVRWMNTSTTAMRLDKGNDKDRPGGGVFIEVPPATHEQALTKRTASMTLAEDGSAKGYITVEF